MRRAEDCMPSPMKFTLREPHSWDPWTTAPHGPLLRIDAESPIFFWIFFFFFFWGGGDYRYTRHIIIKHDGIIITIKYFEKGKRDYKKHELEGVVPRYIKKTLQILKMV